MITAMDAHPDYLDDHEKEFVSKIRECGWHFTHVLAEDEHPGFLYTTGFWLNLGLPDIITFSLKSTTAHSILGDIYNQTKTGHVFEAGKPVSELTTLDTFFQPVDKSHYVEHLGWNRWFYGNDDFKCWQLVWPDANGLFPWQAGFNEALRELQPDLSCNNWNGLA